VDYLDFDLEIRGASPGAYPVSVVRSPAGETHDPLLVEFDPSWLESRLKDLQIALLRSAGRHRRIPAPEERSIVDFGGQLFDSVFDGEVRSRYDVSLEKALEQGRGLRVKLRIRTPQLIHLPWEYLYDRRRGEFLALSRDTPIIRYLDVPQAVQPLVIEPPLRILGMIASPGELQELDVERERRRLDEAIARSRHREFLHLQWLAGETWRDLQRAMRDGTWHVFHFIGHGGFDPSRDEAYVAVGDSAGGPRPLYATELSRLLGDHRPLRLAVLNSCEGARASSDDIFSSCASSLIRRGLPAAVAMQHEISDRAAIEFSSEFYSSLAEGLPVDVAVTEARKAISLAIRGSLEWGTPVLHIRSADGALFEVKPGGKPKAVLDPQPEARPTPPPAAPRQQPKPKPTPQPKPPQPQQPPPIPPAKEPSPRWPLSALRKALLTAAALAGLLVVVGSIVIVIGRADDALSPEWFIEEPGAYLRVALSRGEEVRDEALRAVAVPVDEPLPDWPIDASDWAGFCAMTDLREGHRLTWDDLGDCP
jgi:hypothetical protein